MGVSNYTEFFKEEKDIYVQNVANAQVSIEFNLGNGQLEGYTFPPTRDPVNLTQEIPFNVIKQSMDFRKMLARRPPALQMLSAEEYEAYFTKKAHQRGLKSVDEAIEEAAERRMNLKDRSRKTTEATPEPIHEVTEQGSGPGGMPMFGEKQRVTSTAPVSEEEVLNPKVLHYCNQVKAELEENERMPAQELLESLQSIPNMKLDDYEYIRAHGYYRTVKKWAKNEMAALMTAEEEAEGLDDEEGVQATA